MNLDMGIDMTPSNARRMLSIQECFMINNESKEELMEFAKMDMVTLEQYRDMVPSVLRARVDEETILPILQRTLDGNLQTVWAGMEFWPLAVYPIMAAYLSGRKTIVFQHSNTPSSDNKIREIQNLVDMRDEMTQQDVYDARESLIVVNPAVSQLGSAQRNSLIDFIITNSYYRSIVVGGKYNNINKLKAQSCLMKMWPSINISSIINVSSTAMNSIGLRNVSREKILALYGLNIIE